MRKPRRPKLKQPAKASDLVEKLLQGLGLDERFQQYKALIIWDDVVGPQIAARTKPVRIREGILEVNVDQPAWMQQLQLMKPKILRQLNDRLESASVKDLYLKRGSIKAESAQPPISKPTWHHTQLTDEEKTQVENLLKNVDDPDLHREFGNLLRKQMRLNKTNSL